MVDDSNDKSDPNIYDKNLDGLFESGSTDQEDDLSGDVWEQAFEDGLTPSGDGSSSDARESTGSGAKSKSSTEHADKDGSADDHNQQAKKPPRRRSKSRTRSKTKAPADTASDATKDAATPDADDAPKKESDSLREKLTKTFKKTSDAAKTAVKDRQKEAEPEEPVDPADMEDNADSIDMAEESGSKGESDDTEQEEDAEPAKKALQELKEKVASLLPDRFKPKPKTEPKGEEAQSTVADDKDDTGKGRRIAPGQIIGGVIAIAILGALFFPFGKAPVKLQDDTVQKVAETKSELPTDMSASESHAGDVLDLEAPKKNTGANAETGLGEKVASSDVAPSNPASGEVTKGGLTPKNQHGKEIPPADQGVLVGPSSNPFPDVASEMSKKDNAKNKKMEDGVDLLNQLDNALAKKPAESSGEGTKTASGNTASEKGLMAKTKLTPIMGEDTPSTKEEKSPSQKHKPTVEKNIPPGVVHSADDKKMKVLEDKLNQANTRIASVLKEVQSLKAQEKKQDQVRLRKARVRYWLPHVDLLAVVLRGGDYQAKVRYAGAPAEYVRKGEEIRAWKVVSIDPQHITLLFRDHSQIASIEKRKEGMERVTEMSSLPVVNFHRSAAMPVYGQGGVN